MTERKQTGGSRSRKQEKVVDDLTSILSRKVVGQPAATKTIVPYVQMFQAGLSPEGRICLDAGASTGGFTDVLLAHGAAKVHAVDVGHGQLAWKLRNDPRVVVHEKTNARHLTDVVVANPIQVLVCAASFIGLSTILPACLALCTPGAWAVALIKPQFEAGPGAGGAKGVVRDPEVHRAVCTRVEAWWRGLPGWTVLGIEESPITGPEGNKEFLIAALLE